MRTPEFFLDHYAPVTTHLAFFEMPVSDLAQVLYDRNVKINKDCGFDWVVQKNAVRGTLSEKLHALLPMASGLPTKKLVSQTASRWSVYAVNKYPFGDVHSEPSYLSRVLKIRVLSIIMIKDVPGGQPGSMQFVYRDGPRTKPIETQYGIQHEIPARAVYAHKESKWEFGAYGEPLPFEELDTYTAKRIKDRLTAEMIERYCRNLDIDLFDPDFYAGDGFIIQTYATPDTKFFPSFPNLIEIMS